MSRSRNIKPGFFRNEVLVTLPYEYRLLFVGLWTMADRSGRMEDRPMKIRMEVFPADNVDVETGLDSLHRTGFISRYVVEDKQYIQIVAWDKHQNPHVKEAASTIPAPGENGARNVPAPEIPARAGLIPDSLNLIPDSKGKAKVLVQPSAARFDEWYSLYPVKKGKEPARKTWAREKLDAQADDLITHTKLMLAYDDDWRRGYAPMASTYLNQKRWQDEPKGPRQESTHAPSKGMNAILKLQEMTGGLDHAGSGAGASKATLLAFRPPSVGRHDPGDGNGMG